MLEKRPRDEAPGQEEESFGARLRGLREAAGLTQEELADKARSSRCPSGFTKAGAAELVAVEEVAGRSVPPWFTSDSLSVFLIVVPGRRPFRRPSSRGARLLGAAEALLEAAGLVLYAQARDDENRQRAADAARERLGEEVWITARSEGRAMTFEEAVAYALGDDEALLPALP